MPPEAILTFLGVLAGSVLTFFGVRFTARQTRKAAETAAQVNNRQVDVDEWKSLVTALREEVGRLSTRVERLEDSREADRKRIETLEADIRVKEIRHRLLIQYVRELLHWAKRFAPEHVPPQVPARFADDLN